MSSEIERKWLMSGKPKLMLLNRSIIRQAYLIAEDNYEVRLRTRFDFDSYFSVAPKIIDHKLTLKMGNGISRDEFEYKISSELAEELAKDVHGLPITKQFYKFQTADGRHVHWSVVDPDLDSTFIYAEVEFPTIKSAESWIPPKPFEDMIIREVTGDPEWQLKNYWCRTRMSRG